MNNSTATVPIWTGDNESERTRWEELKVQMQYERESAYESVSYSKSYARLEDTLFNQGQYEAFKKVQAIMDKLEKK